MTRVKAEPVDDLPTCASQRLMLSYICLTSSAVSQKALSGQQCSYCRVLMLAPNLGGICDACRRRYTAQASEAAQGKRKVDAIEELQAMPCTEYQTPSAMYEVLRSTVTDFYKANDPTKAHTPYVFFHGTFSVVADPQVPNKMQSTLVSQELQKIVKLPHRWVYAFRFIMTHSWGSLDSYDSSSKAEDATSYTAVCRCECDMKIAPPKPTIPVPTLGPAFLPAPAPVLATASLTFVHSSLSSAPASTQPTPVLQLAPPGVPPPAKKPRQSTLSTWILREGTKKPPVLPLALPGVSISAAAPPAVTTTAPAPATIMTEPVAEKVQLCGGTVRITISDDLSHAYFKGQKVVVEVSHPSRKS